MRGVFWMVDGVCVCVASCGGGWSATVFAWFAAGHTYIPVL